MGDRGQKPQVDGGRNQILFTKSHRSVNMAGGERTCGKALPGGERWRARAKSDRNSKCRLLSAWEEWSLWAARAVDSRGGRGGAQMSVQTNEPVGLQRSRQGGLSPLCPGDTVTSRLCGGSSGVLGASAHTNMRCVFILLSRPLKRLCCVRVLVRRAGTLVKRWLRPTAAFLATLSAAVLVASFAGTAVSLSSAPCSLHAVGLRRAKFLACVLLTAEGMCGRSTVPSSLVRSTV